MNTNSLSQMLHISHHILFLLTTICHKTYWFQSVVMIVLGTRGWFHSERSFISSYASVLLICTASVICRSMESFLNVHSSEGGLESHLEISTPTYMVQSHLFIQNPSPTSQGVPPNIWYTLESHLIKSKFPFSCYKMTITDEQTGRPPLAQATLQIKWNEKLWFVRW